MNSLRYGKNLNFTGEGGNKVHALLTSVPLLEKNCDFDPIYLTEGSSEKIPSKNFLSPFTLISHNRPMYLIESLLRKKNRRNLKFN